MVRLLLAALAMVVTTGCAHSPPPPQPLKVQRLGGLAGFGAPGSRLRSQGEIDLATLSPADRQAIDALFSRPPTDPPHPDQFRYRLTRPGGHAPQTVEVPEDRLPESVRSAVQEELSR